MGTTTGEAPSSELLDPLRTEAKAAAVVGAVAAEPVVVLRDIGAEMGPKAGEGSAKGVLGPVEGAEEDPVCEV